MTATTHPLSTLSARRRLNASMRSKGIPAKVCGRCLVVKGHAAFSKNSAAPDVRSSMCLACTRENSRAWQVKNTDRLRRYRAANAERVRETSRAWNAANLDKRRGNEQRRRATKAEVTQEPFTHTELFADWADQGIFGCVYCGGPFEHIEHVQPLSRGGAHALGNLTAACAACNGSKRDRDPIEWLAERFPTLADKLHAL